MKSATTSRRMRREWEAQRGALATVRRFNATLSAKGYVWFSPKITAALTSKHHWLVIACDSCGSVMDLDMWVKPRDPEASIRMALREVQCPRCNGHGRPGIIALARHASYLKTRSPARNFYNGVSWVVPSDSPVSGVDEASETPAHCVIVSSQIGHSNTRL